MRYGILVIMLALGSARPLHALQNADVQLDLLAVKDAVRAFCSCSKTAPLTEHLERAIENRVFSIAIH